MMIRCTKAADAGGYPLMMLEFPDQEKSAIFFEVEQSIRGMHGPNRQFAGINFLETLVSEFSPSTASSMGLPKEFHEQCQWSLEVKFLKHFSLLIGKYKLSDCYWQSPWHHEVLGLSSLEADADRSPMSADGVLAASSLFKIIVESHLKAAADSAFEDSDDAEYFHVSVSKRDEQLALYALIARAAAETTIPFLEQLFSERFAWLSQEAEGRKEAELPAWMVDCHVSSLLRALRAPTDTDEERGLRC
uniref:Uncharacterized protein n=1 Tax=Avena sativa TaxID=4498 RepID=A0ACD6AMA3_AVESA